MKRFICYIVNAADFRLNESKIFLHIIFDFAMFPFVDFHDNVVHIIYYGKKRLVIFVLNKDLNIVNSFLWSFF